MSCNLGVIINLSNWKVSRVLILVFEPGHIWMLIVIQSCQWFANLRINLSPRVTQYGKSIIAKLVNIIINCIYLADFREFSTIYYMYFVYSFNAFHQRLCLLDWSFLLLACVLIFLLNMIAVFYQYPQLASNGKLIIHLIEKTLGQCTLIMDNPQGGQFA